MTRPRQRLLAFCAACLLCAAGNVTASGDAEAWVGDDLRAGDSLETALQKLNARGVRVVYSSALVRREMTLAAVPDSRDIDTLLAEILTPWQLRATRSSNGDWLIGAAPVVVAAAAGISAPGDSVRAVETIESIDVTATRLRLAVPGATELFLDREDVQRLPHLADDAMRMLKVMPGVTGGDFSAALNVRGGRREETLLTIDGAKIHNAFHFRDIDGALSVLDTNLVDNIDFITGGMTADIGDHMSGVVGLQSRRPSPEDEFRSGAGISFVSAYAYTSGNFAADRGSWLVSARRGFLDVITERVVEDDEQLTPRYTDVFAATDFDVNENTKIAARLLFSDDDLKFATREEDDIESSGGGRSANLWFTLDHAFSDALHSRTLLSVAEVNQSRNAGGVDDDRAGSVRMDNDFRYVDLRQDWNWTLRERHLARWGFDLGDQQADYDYALESWFFEPLVAPVPVERTYSTLASLQMRKLGLYAAWRSQLDDRFTVELGGRWDRYAYDPGEEFDAFSPRVNLVYDLAANHQLRAAWGIVHQAQAVNELQVEDNVTTFFAPEQVRQAVLGYQWQFAPGHSLRVDVYDKRYSDLHPRFENALDPIDFIPESAPDRIRIDAPTARARGIELTMRREVEQGFSGWLSLILARAEDQDADDGRHSRSWEQRKTLSFGTSWTGAGWDLSLAGLLHDGLPTTYIGIDSEPLPDGGYEIEGIVGPRNAERFGTYARLDLRATREAKIDYGRLWFYIEITNLLNRDNECCIEDYHVEQSGNSAPFLDIEKGYWLPLVPSFGIRWEF